MEDEPFIIKLLKKKSVAVVGFAREGISSYYWIRKTIGNKQLAIFDESKEINLSSPAQEILRKDKNLKLHLGSQYLKHLSRYDIIIRSPGVPWKLVKKYSTHKATITSQTKLFFELFKGKIIGITGTKGKSTTAALIYRVLASSRKNIYLLGNIGKPPLDMLHKSNEHSLAVFELSSHQLIDLEQSPHISVLLNIFPEHLDYYDTFVEYRNAKAQICKFQTKDDIIIFNLEDSDISKIAQTSKAIRIPFSLSKLSQSGCFIENNNIVTKIDGKYQPIVSTKKVSLIGKFNLRNIMPAVILGIHFGVEKEQIKKAIQSFKPLPDRLEIIGEFRGISFINDSLATNPEATIQAIKALDGKIGSLILGGYERRRKHDELAKVLLKSKIETIILFPDTGKKIKTRLIELDRDIIQKKNILNANSMKEAIQIAYEFTKVGNICLLSPAAASFNMFKDYKHRGNEFKKWAKKVSKW